MGRTRRDKASPPRAVRALLDLAALADALPAPLLLADPLGRSVHANPAFLLAFGAPPSPWTALASGPDRGMAEAAWLTAGATRRSCDARIGFAAGQALARVTPVESGRRLLGWAVALAPIPAAPAPPALPARPSAEAPPPAQAAESRLALEEERRREAEDRRAEAEARADRLADRLRAIEVGRPAAPLPVPEPPRGASPDPFVARPPRPVPAHVAEPLASAPPEPGLASLSEPIVPPVAEPAPARPPAVVEPLQPTVPPDRTVLPAPAPEASVQAGEPPPDGPGLARAPREPGDEAELGALARRIEAPALRRALALWQAGADGRPRPGEEADPEVDRLALAELGAGGELGAVRTLRATAAAPPLAAILPLASDPGWARCARERRPVVQRAELALGQRRLEVERLFLPLRDGEGRSVLLIEVLSPAMTLPPSGSAKGPGLTASSGPS